MLTRACHVCLDGVPLRARLPDPSWLVALVALDDYGSYRAAARAVGCSHVALRKRVVNLADHLKLGDLAIAGKLTAIGRNASTQARRMIAELAVWGVRN